MKVAVYLREVFTDADRERIAVVLDGARLDRLASRDEVKEYYGLYGQQWRAILDKEYSAYTEQDLEDLI